MPVQHGEPLQHVLNQYQPPNHGLQLSTEVLKQEGSVHGQDLYGNALDGTDPNQRFFSGVVDGMMQVRTEASRKEGKRPIDLPCRRA